MSTGLYPSALGTVEAALVSLMHEQTIETLGMPPKMSLTEQGFQLDRIMLEGTMRLLTQQVALTLQIMITAGITEYGKSCMTVRRDGGTRSADAGKTWGRTQTDGLRHMSG